MQIKTTLEIFNLLESDFNHNQLLKDKHFYFIETLIRQKADKKAKYLSSEKLGKTFGKRVYKPIVDYFIEKGIIETYSNRQDGRFNYYTYKLLVSTKKTIDYQLTSPTLIRTIEYFYNTNYDSLKDFEKQVLYNIQKLQLPSEFDVPRLYMSKSKNTGRLFHPIVNMPRNQRKYLKHVDGIRLGELDGKNAQLVMLSHLFYDDEVFNDAVYGGEFYQMMADEMGIDISNDANKKEFKRKFFNSILFNENRLVVANSKYGKAFKKLFPITFHHLIEMQTNKSKATELQWEESNLFINNITRDLVNERLFVIPIHDAIIFNLDEIERVEKIINDNCYNYLGRLISLSLEEFCPTPCSKYTTYNNLYNINNEGREEENKSQRGVYVVQNHKGVGQNKNTQLQEEKVNVITQTIKQLMADNQKITIRKVQELSGVAKATVEKHYKAIIIQISQDNTADKQICVSENKVSEIACDNDIIVEHKCVMVKSNDIQTLPNAVKEEHKISWSQITQIEVAEEVYVVDSSVNILELTANEIKDLGYSDIEFRTSFGQVLLVPKVYEQYWDGIKNKLGIMKRLSKENNQLGFDIELRSILQNMFELKSAV